MKKTFYLVAFVISLLPCRGAIAGEVAVPHTFQANTPARASEVNNNFTAVKTAVDDNNSRITSNAVSIGANNASILVNASDILDIKDDVAAIQASGLTATTVLTTYCVGIDFFWDGVYSKVADIGVFYKYLSQSVVEVQFNGSVYAVSYGTGAVFELRVDDLPTTEGWARIALKFETMGYETTGSMTAIFPDIDSGYHTVSVWVRGANGNGGSAIIDQGCWSSTHVVVKEMN